MTRTKGRYLKVKDGANIKYKIYVNKCWWQIFNVGQGMDENYILLHLRAPFKGCQSVNFLKEDEYYFKLNR